MPEAFSKRSQLLQHRLQRLGTAIETIEDHTLASGLALKLDVFGAAVRAVGAANPVRQPIDVRRLHELEQCVPLAFRNL